MKSKKFVIVGRNHLPAETTVTCAGLSTALEVVKCFLPGGSMHRKGDEGMLSIYLPGTGIPEEVAKHMPSDHKFLSRAKVEGFLERLPKASFFFVKFVKKDGTVREMNCRRGVKKHLKGGESTIKDYTNLVSVFDTKAKSYRCFDVERVLEIR